MSENSTGKKSRKASGEQKASTHKQDDNDGEVFYDICNIRTRAGLD